jgi:acyl carrier protein
MTKACPICDAATSGDADVTADVYCQECAQLLRWFRSYFAHEPKRVLEWITPERSFVELGVDSLDYMNWLLEAEEKLGGAFSDEEAERIHTVGQFLHALRARGAAWSPDCDLLLLHKANCLRFREYAWVKVQRGDAQRGIGKPLSPPLPAEADLYDRELDG